MKGERRRENEKGDMGRIVKFIDDYNTNVTPLWRDIIFFNFFHYITPQWC